MNKARRKILSDIRNEMELQKASLENLRDEEEEAFNNLSEGLQTSERGQKMEEASYQLSDALDSLEYVISQIDGVLES